MISKFCLINEIDANSDPFFRMFVDKYDIHSFPSWTAAFFRGSELSGDLLPYNICWNIFHTLKPIDFFQIEDSYPIDDVGDGITLICYLSFLFVYTMAK